jgi:hypothetical protein
MLPARRSVPRWRVRRPATRAPQGGSEVASDKRVPISAVREAQAEDPTLTAHRDAPQSRRVVAGDPHSRDDDMQQTAGTAAELCRRFGHYPVSPGARVRWAGPRTRGIRASVTAPDRPAAASAPEHADRILGQLAEQTVDPRARAESRMALPPAGMPTEAILSVARLPPSQTPGPRPPCARHR